MGFQITNDPAADTVLDEYPLAVVIGMQLDQQYPIEHAFRGGWKILSRFGSLDPAAIAAADPVQFTELCRTPPAIHRYPAAKAARVQELAREQSSISPETPCLGRPSAQKDLSARDEPSLHFDRTPRTRRLTSRRRNTGGPA